MNHLIEKIRNRESGILLYGLTPSKASDDEEKSRRIANRRLSRIRGISVDAIVLYDIQDEASRNSEVRPFPFIAPIEPLEYKKRFFQDLDLPTVFYQCVGKYSPGELEKRMSLFKDECLVLVGSSSRGENVLCRLPEAYRIAGGFPDIALGGISIPERHGTRGNEHTRLLSKQEAGIGFFISQFIFNVEKAKDMVSDYFYLCRDSNREPVPLIFTLTPCGSERTVNLLEWLGVSIPRWMRNELSLSENPLDMSMELCMSTIADLASFCLRKGIPFGCNVESASVGKEEVLASFELVKRVERLFMDMGIR